MKALFRRAVVVASAALALSSLGAVPASATAPSGPLVHIQAHLACLDTGGVKVTLWIRNVSDRVVRISNDIQLWTHIVRDTGRVNGPFAFAFPAINLLKPKQTSRLVIPLGDGSASNPGVDMSGLMLRLLIAVPITGHVHPAVERFTYPGCPPPPAPA